MVTLKDYDGREQSYVKHVFLESYLERLVHKTASSYTHIVYVDGFAGPWQSANEKFEDTSFPAALDLPEIWLDICAKNVHDMFHDVAPP